MFPVFAGCLVHTLDPLACHRAAASHCRRTTAHASIWQKLVSGVCEHDSGSGKDVRDVRVAKQDRHLRAESASSRSTSSSALEPSRGFRFLGPRKPKQQGFISSSAGGGTVEPTFKRRRLWARCQKEAPSGFYVRLLRVSTVSPGVSVRRWTVLARSAG